MPLLVPAGAGVDCSPLFCPKIAEKALTGNGLALLVADGLALLVADDDDDALLGFLVGNGDDDCFRNPRPRVVDLNRGLPSLE